MSSGPAPPQDAPAPFSGAPDPEETIPPADFILRSSDGVDLHVHKDILKFVSVFFKNMLDGAGHETELHRDGKPILALPEPGAALYRLLCIAYPGESLEHYSLAAQSLDGVSAVYTAANKYMFIRVQKMLKAMLDNRTLLDAHPHRLFAIARLCELPDLARTAALSTLKYPVCPPGLVFPEMELLTAATFQKLYNFHHSCGLAAKEIAEDNAGYLDDQYAGEPDAQYGITVNRDADRALVWWEPGAPGYHDEECGPHVMYPDGPGYPQRAPTQWFRNHVAKLVPHLRALPTGQTVAAKALNIAPEERAVIDGCHACLELAETDLASYARQLADKIEGSNMRLGEHQLCGLLKAGPGAVRTNAKGDSIGLTKAYYGSLEAITLLWKHTEDATAV
ncbi:hypothetical protein FB451DRAFT_1486188 [Mycena latifolia]|nr:hypothetical protein FB451DRAFT_1486188 [Mycena latifolia]